MSRADLSADWFDDERVLLSLHHSTCRPTGVGSFGSMPEWPPTVACLSGLSGPFPVLAVNPSAEQVLLRRAGDGWCEATLDPYLDLGFDYGSAGLSRTARDVRISITEAAVVVESPAGLPQSASRGERWVLDTEDEVRARIRSVGRVVLVLTTRTLPVLDLDEVLADPACLWAWVSLAR